MHGEFLPVWSETWRDIWSKLAKHNDAPEDLFSELYLAQVKPPRPPTAPPPPTEVDESGQMVRPDEIRAVENYTAALALFAVERARFEEVVSGDTRARPAFRKALQAEITTEAEAIDALGRAFSVIDGYDIDSIRSYFFLLVEKFIQKFSLRYDLRRPFTLHPTLPGIFAGLVREMKAVARADAHLHQLMSDFEDAVRDLTADSSSGRIKTCIQKQMNLLEAI